MKIKSPFKDYYDFVAFQYGGGDPKIVYPRIRLAERDPRFGVMGIVEVQGLDKIPRLPGYNTRLGLSYDQKWLAIAGKLYLLVREYSTGGDTNWGVYKVGEHPKLDECILHRRWYDTSTTYEDYVGKKCDKLIPIHRQVKAPVFCIAWGFDSGVEGDIPILADLGIPSLVSPEQMYQDLSYFMGNIINESPDLQPESKPPMTDKEKVLSHGFDAKQSFRHRT